MTAPQEEVKPSISKLIVEVVITLAILFLIFALGRYTAPTKTVEIDHVTATKTEATTKAQTADQEKAKTEATKTAVKKHVHTTKTTVKAPDGTVTTKVEQDTDSATGTTTATTEKDKLATTTAESSTTTEHSEHDHSKITTTLRPDTRVGLMAGAVTWEPRVIYGVEVEKRIVGPLWAGAWIINLGTITNPKLAGGLKAAVEF